jgi:carbonic anhydrase
MSVKCQIPKSPAPTYSFRETPPCATATRFESASGNVALRGSYMCAEQETGQPLHRLHRRSFLKVSGAITAMAFVGTGALSSIAHADALTKAQRDKLSPNDILALMKKGNKRFYTGKREDHNFLAQQRASAKGQYPAAVLLTCIDSRASAETILDLRIGDIFNSRVAGNVENSDILGSMEFACKLAGAKVVLVMGHTGCGAIKGAIDNAELGNLTGLLAKIKPAVAATTYTGERTSKNYAFVDAVARKNVEITLADIRKDSPVLAEMESNGAIKIAGAMYNLETGVVDFFAG